MAISLIAATFVAVLPAAAAPLFLGTAQSATVNAEVADACPSTSGAVVHYVLYSADAGSVHKQIGDVASVLATVPDLAPMQTTLYRMRGFVRGLPSDDPAARPWFVTVMARDGFQNHVQVVEQADLPEKTGVYVPDDIAKAWKVHAGDTIGISSDGRSAPVKIRAIYKNMNVGRVDRFWCSVKGIFQGNVLAENGQPALILADTDTVLAIMGHTPAQAVALYESSLSDPAPPPDQVSRIEAGLGQVLPRLRRIESGAGRYTPDGMTLDSSLPLFATRARLVGGTLRAPIYAVSAAGVLVGLLVLGASTLLWTRRREHELMVLAVRGASPLALGFKAVLETLPAVIAGGALAAVTARWIVAEVGPSGTMSAAATRQAAWLSAGVAAAEMIVVLVVAVLRSRLLTDFSTHVQGRSRLVTAPWELLALVAAVPIWQRMGGDLVSTGGDDLAVGGQVVQLPPRALVVPILVIVTVTIFVARVVAAYLRRFSLTRSPRNHARYLAWRRLGREPMVAATLLAIAAAPAAVAGFGGMAAQSVQTTIESKALASVGSDVVITVGPGAAVTPAITRFGPATLVIRTDSISVSGFQASLLGVDPEQFKKVAVVGDALAGAKFADTLDKIAQPAPDTMTVLASAPIEGGDAEIVSGAHKIKVKVVAAPGLPGQYNGIPIVIANRAQIPAGFFDVSKTQIWSHTDNVAAVDAAARSDARGVDVIGVNVAKNLYADTLFQPITYTFEYFVAIALLTGVVVAVGLLLYLESRTVAHRRAYVMLRRMGLKPGTHRAALLWELCGALGLGLLVAAGTVAALGIGLKRSFDVNPVKQPGTVLVVPAAPLAVVIGCVVLTAIGAALFGHARVARANPAEVLRDAT